MSAHVPLLLLDSFDRNFETKIIPLHGEAIHIGRQHSDATAPSTDNGFFASNLLSRRHAEVWEQDGKIWIRDTKSSNGTFVNSRRLSAEGIESEPCELKTDDILEFGTDILSEDNIIVHRKVKAQVSCIFPPPPPAMHFADGTEDQWVGRETATSNLQSVEPLHPPPPVPQPQQAVLHLVYVGKRRLN